MRIALVKLSSLGDVVHALPVAATLRARLPAARLTWVVERREAAVLAGHPALDEVIAVDTRRWRRARRAGEVAAAARDVVALARRLRGARVDVALDLQGLLKSGVLAALTRAPLRVGFEARHCREPLSALLSTRRVAPPPGARHVVDQYLALLAPLGVREPVYEFRLPADPEADAAIGDFFAAAALKPRDGVVALNPGAGRPDKRWPPPRFADLARRLLAAGRRVLVVWGPGEEAAARAIAGGTAGGAVLAPPTDLMALIALLRRASALVAADTGPLHLAAALGTPCVGLFGPTRAERNGPWGPGHRTVSAADGRMGSIAVAPVAAALEAVLA